MSAEQLHTLSLHAAARLLRNREISSRELTADCLKRIEQVEPQLRALITVCADQAMAQASEADRVLLAGDGAPLTGIPFVAKDLLCTRGVRTTCASRMLENFIPPYDATVIARLRAQHAVMLGKSNMDEFAMGSSTEQSAFFPTRNPWNLDCVPGGSSGGSAAALAADEALFSIGSDSGGSIRQPAAFCGVVGLKPTYGRVSRYGAVAFASSLDQVGPLSKDVRDCALIMNVISGQCPHDSTSAPVPVPDFTSFLDGQVRGLRIGVPREYFVPALQPEVRDSVEHAITLLEHMGASIDRDLSLPATRYAMAAYYIIAPAEASANLARFDGVRYGFARRLASNEESVTATRDEGFGPEVKRRIMLGTHVLSSGYYDAYYVKAQKVRHLINEEFKRAFAEHDVLAMPTSLTAAFPLGSKVSDPMQMYLNDLFTLPGNIAGIPGISLPCGFVDGLPIGLQLMADHFREDLLLKVGHAYEQATDWSRQRPTL